MLPVDDIPRFAGISETAEVLNMGHQAVRTGVRDGTIPHLKVGRNVRIPLRAIVVRLEAGDSDLDGITYVEEGASGTDTPSPHESHTGDQTGGAA